jgi:hypothetical protein
VNPRAHRWMVTTFGLGLTCAAASMAGSNRDTAPDKAAAGVQASQVANTRMAPKIAAQAPLTSVQRIPMKPYAVSAHD